MPAFDSKVYPSDDELRQRARTSQYGSNLYVLIPIETYRYPHAYAKVNMKTGEVERILDPLPNLRT